MITVGTIYLQSWYPVLVVHGRCHCNSGHNAHTHTYTMCTYFLLSFFPTPMDSSEQVCYYPWFQASISFKQRLGTYTPTNARILLYKNTLDFPTACLSFSELCFSNSHVSIPQQSRKMTTSGCGSLCAMILTVPLDIYFPWLPYGRAKHE